MRAIVLTGNKHLELKEILKPVPNKDEVLIRIHTCGVCRTDLHIYEGDLPSPHYPIVLGHQIVGTIEEVGEEVSNFQVGDRVGVPWLGGTCGQCEFCRSLRENLCNYATFTGYQRNGGFAEYTTANSNYIFPLPSSYSDEMIAPLLCAGFIGFRALKATGFFVFPWVKNIGFYGFGSSAHILSQIVKHKRGKVFAFTKPGDLKGQLFAKDLGVFWAGGSDVPPPELLDAAIIFAPTGELMTEALKVIKKGGSVISVGIHMSDIPSFPYRSLWEERSLSSVANLTREDGNEFLELASEFPINTQVHLYPLEKTEEALNDLRGGKFKGSAVIRIHQNLKNNIVDLNSQ